MTKTTDDLLIERDGAILTLTLNDTKTRNSLSREMSQVGAEVLTDANYDDGIRVVILRGADGNFCSGGNITRLQASIAAGMNERMASVSDMHGWIKAIRRCSKPVIAAVEGAAAGAGFSIVMACDLIVAASDARFVVAYVKIGLNPDGGATAFLNRGLPPQVASELCFLGDPVSAERLHALGVVNRVVEPGETLATARDLADRLASGPRAALARAKQLIDASRRNDFEAQLDMEARLISEARSHPEAAEGLQAFLEKRKPDFSKF